MENTLTTKQIVKEMKSQNKSMEEIVKRLQTKQIESGYPPSPKDDWILFIEKNIN